MGDFNYRRVDLVKVLGNLEFDDFLKVIQDNFLRQVVKEPNRGDNTLDSVVTNNSNMIRDIQVGEPKK